eukprot:337338-Rhodomonas_salina.3
MSGTDICHTYDASRCPVLTADFATTRLPLHGPGPAISLCGCYAMSGTDLPYGPTRRDGSCCYQNWALRLGISLRARYAMSGTDLAHRSDGAMQSSVLT